jgi:hypothetical protein
MVILNTADYTEKVMALLGDPVYKKLAKDHTQTVGWRTALLIKGSLPEDVAKQLRSGG